MSKRAEMIIIGGGCTLIFGVGVGLLASQHSNTGSTLQNCRSQVLRYEYAPELCDGPRNEQELITSGFRYCANGSGAKVCRDAVVTMIMAHQGLDVNGVTLSPAMQYSTQ